MSLMMSEYCPYVWSAYGITLLIFTMHVIIVWKEKKKIQKILHRQSIEPIVSAIHHASLTQENQQMSYHG